MPELQLKEFLVQMSEFHSKPLGEYVYIKYLWKFRFGFATLNLGQII